MESGKWRNVEQLGQNTTNVSPKKAKEGWEGGQLTGQGGSESQIKSSRGKKKKKKAAFAAVTCHAKHGFSGQTPKKRGIFLIIKNLKNGNASYQQCFFFLRPISIHRVIFHPISVHRVVPRVVSFPFRSPARHESARELAREAAREGPERESESACGE